MMNRFQTLLSNSTCAATTWFPAGPALRKMEVEHGLLFRFVIGNPQAGAYTCPHFGST